MTEIILLIVQIFFIILDFSFFCCCIIGNSIVIYVISRDRKLKSKSNYHILSVALADLLIGVLSIPLGVYAGLTGAPHDFQLCLVLNSVLLSVFAVSHFSLLGVSIDRYWAVCYPLTYHVKGSTLTKFMISCCWILGILFGFLPVFGWNSGHFENICDLRVIADLNYLLFVCVTLSFTSTLTMIVLYSFIYRAILKQAKKREEIVANQNETMKQKQEIRAAHTLAMVVGTFIVLWSPGIICLFIISFTKNRELHIDILEFSTILVHCNAAIDPLIYAYRMKNIREALNRLFVCLRKKENLRENSVTTSSDKRSSKTSSIKTTSA
ncbi:CLUMA_CG013689, isoform A [Clunio marinus]|uniref:CLUMA_CG013689, isoform A n=1 Tax=Clunio marinus TaxID=568069 RepID=A0A1J1IJK2_9DIPT|nr:CLUMA_CG013689, isoform A [Clunio marinus]